MKLITLEEHFTTKRYLDATSGMADGVGRIPGIKEKLLDIGTGRIDAMDESAIDIQVLSFTGFGLYEMNPDVAIGICEDANDQILKAKQDHPARFGGFATLPMQDPQKAAKEFESCIQRGFQGAMIDGTVEGEFLDKEKFLPIFEVAAATGAPIYLHPAPPPEPVRQAYTGDLNPPFDFLMASAAWTWHTETGFHSLRLMLSGLFDRFPSLKIIIGHMGENLPYSIARANAVLTGAGLKLDRSPLETFQNNFWITNSGYFTLPPFLCAKEILSEERILLSVDYPFSPMSMGPKIVKDLDAIFHRDQLEKFAHGNAEMLLKV